MPKYIKVKKPFSYYYFVREAIQMSHGHMATTAMIFKYAQNRYPSVFQNVNSMTWKANIRQILSKHPGFIKQEDIREGKLHYWIYRDPHNLYKDEKLLKMCLDDSYEFIRNAFPDDEVRMNENKAVERETHTVENNDVYVDIMDYCKSDAENANNRNINLDEILKCGCIGECFCQEEGIHIHNDYTPLSDGRYNEYGFWFQSYINEEDTGDELWDKMWFKATIHSKRKKKP